MYLNKINYTKNTSNTNTALRQTPTDNANTVIYLVVEIFILILKFTTFVLQLSDRPLSEFCCCLLGLGVSDFGRWTKLHPGI